VATRQLQRARLALGTAYKDALAETNRLSESPDAAQLSGRLHARTAPALYAAP